MAMQRCRTRCWCGRSTSRISCRRRHWDQGMVDSVDENWGYPYGKHPYEHEARLGTYKQRWRERFWPRAMCETCLLWQIMGDRKTCWRLWAMVICIVFGRYSEGRGEWRKGGWLAQMWVEKHGKKKSMNIYVLKKQGLRQETLINTIWIHLTFYWHWNLYLATTYWIWNNKNRVPKVPNW